MNLTITEVGLRDGIQSEAHFVPTADKIRLIDALFAAGVRSIEATSFVSPHAVPQMADAEDVVRGVHKPIGTRLCALAPNSRGVHAAIRAGVDDIVVFLSASESHNRKNLNRSIDASLAAIEETVALAVSAGVGVKGAIAVAFGCPFEGDVESSSVVRIARAFTDAGVSRITLGDTTGMASPEVVKRVCGELKDALPNVEPALHFHNTRGMALLNVAAGLGLGINTYESALGGTGGCPFAPGATGNVCTEDLVNFLHESGHETGINLEALIDASVDLERVLGRTLPGQVMRAGPRSRLHPLDSVRTATAKVTI
ncbi:hydroxymethylglutaryl-CoA lyase [Paraburkholderia silviterrae]|uniref:hydroxymethylglutaryl-CoA lyase n=1 Tax=Paraburkholderia silviterrae TaxID=2528715 RepID=UPI001F0DE3E7|nr:hydroxymethylglutaryl-CoA lyase [Paraburkholderia silviterrae]